MPVEVPGAKKGETFKFDTDEHPRPGTTAEKLKPLRAAFKPDGGTVTAGNASGINDGAAAVVIMSDAQGEGARTHAARHHPQLRLRRCRSRDHGHGPVAGVREGARRRPASARRRSTSGS